MSVSQSSPPAATRSTNAPVVDAGQAANAGVSGIGDAPLGPGFIVQEGTVEPLLARVTRLERIVRMQFYAFVALIVVSGAFLFDGLLIEHVIVRQNLMESKELKLLDSDGNPRLFLRMYSKVPVLQIMDSNGRPRMSMGLRFDDSPFVDLSDSTGRTRASLEITADDAPALRMFDRDGNPTFNIN